MRLSCPLTVSAKVVPFEVSVGVEGVDPLSWVHPEKLLSAKLVELNHRLVASLPRTTIYNLPA